MDLKVAQCQPDLYNSIILLVLSLEKCLCLDPLEALFILAKVPTDMSSNMPVNDCSGSADERTPNCCTCKAVKDFKTLDMRCLLREYRDLFGTDHVQPARFFTYHPTGAEGNLWVFLRKVTPDIMGNDATLMALANDNTVRSIVDDVLVHSDGL